MGIIDDSSRADFAAAYPLHPARLAHGLADHPLLTLDALAALAARMRPETLEHNAALDAPLGTRLADLPGNGLTSLQTIERIAECGSWILLREIEQDPAYARLMDEVLGELAPIISARTGPMRKLRAFVFLSSPGALTQPHFDPEYNILFQIHGAKTMTLFPVADPEVMGDRFIEQYYCGGQRYLPWQSDWDTGGQPIRIEPGEAIHVPLLAPHWVQVHAAVSISLSLTWCSDWSIETAEAYKFNRRLRGLGLVPRSPGGFPASNRTKALGNRLVERFSPPGFSAG